MREFVTMNEGRKFREDYSIDSRRDENPTKKCISS